MFIANIGASLVHAFRRPPRLRHPAVAPRLGAPVQDENVCALTKASGINSLDDWFAAKRPIKLGGEAPGANDSDVPRALKAALGLPIQLIEGFKGTANIRVAAEAGEVDGGCWT